MNIGIDAKPLTKNKTGIGIYVEQVVKRLNEMDHENNYFLYTPREFVIDESLNKNFTLRQKITGQIGFVIYLMTLHKKLKDDKIDLYWGTQHYLPRITKKTKNIKYVLTIHDLAIKRLKTVGSWKTTLMQKFFLKKSIKNADKIIAISEATKKDIVEFFKIPEEKIEVIYNGTNFDADYKITEEEKREIEEKFNLKDKPFLFFLSTIEPRKNIETLIKAFNYIRRKEETNLKLIIAGGLGWKYQNVLDLVNKSEFKEDIIMPGYISKAEKKYFYENAEVFVYPSLYEGFGLPVLEAMSNKCLVITANNSSLPEVGGNAAFYYDSVLNYSELGNKIIEIINLSEEEKKDKIDQGLKRVSKFTWEKCGKETVEILNKKN